MTKIGLIQFVLLLLISAAYGQKVKYKDIYALLSAKQYEQAEPFLRNYLRQNDDNPSAYLFMANIFQEKASKNDILKETTLAVSNIDSALFYYGKAYPLIDEREVKRNKEYYQSYSRRDLRTGEFGVKLSDIQFDIEKNIERLKERTGKIRLASRCFILADSTYQRVNASFLALQQRFPSLDKLFLRAGDETVQSLSLLASRFDSCMKAFEEYRAVLPTLGKTGYAQKLSLRAITDFTRDGKQLSDLYAETVNWWNYRAFADEAMRVIEQEIVPMRKHLVAYDKEIDKLSGRLRSDSVSVRSDLAKLADGRLSEALHKFDAHPLPVEVFALKSSVLEYRSSVIENIPLRDSSDLHLQVRLVNQELMLLAKIDSIAENLLKGDMETRAQDYAAFVLQCFGGRGALARYIGRAQEFAKGHQKEKQELLAQYLKALDYIVDGTDSIPLVHGAPGVFRPLIIAPEKFTVGLSFRDTTNTEAYFYTIEPSRKPGMKQFFPVNPAVFNPSASSNAKALAYADDGGGIYYLLLYSDKPLEGKFVATLSKLDRAGGLAWKADYSLPFIPAELLFNSETGALTIRNGDEQVVVGKGGGKI